MRPESLDQEQVQLFNDLGKFMSYAQHKAINKDADEIEKLNLKNMI